MQLEEAVESGAVTAGRKRAAIELIAREGTELSRTARRYSLCAEDAEDAYQRALEILLLKAPSDRPRELIRWTKTVVKHEALAIRRNRERLLGPPRAVRDGEEAEDPIARLPAGGSSPAERLELHEDVARSREALQTLKPAELRSLTLLATGHSYAEIGEITGFSRTKVNRCLAEGRERFRRFLSRSEDGSRCTEMGPLLSAFCDGEARPEDEVVVRAHLRACAGCRATMRAYRATPAAVAVLAPALPLSRSFVERAQELLAGLHSRLPGTGGATDAGIAQVATTGGARGVGVAALAKALAICAGAVGGAAACVATGVAPAPFDLTPQQSRKATIERIAEPVIEEGPAVESPPTVEHRSAAPLRKPHAAPPAAEPERSQPAEPAEPAPAVEAAPTEYAPPPPEAVDSAPSGGSATASGGSPAGEFGP